MGVVKNERSPNISECSSHINQITQHTQFSVEYLLKYAALVKALKVIKKDLFAECFMQVVAALHADKNCFISLFWPIGHLLSR